MTDEVVTAPEDVTPREALELMYDHKIERVPIVDDENRLVGLVTMQGILQRREYDQAARADDGSLRCGAAVGPFEMDRAQVADEAGVDILFIDCAHAHNANVIESAREIKAEVDADVVVGNIGTREAAEAVVDFADGVKVGIGPGSICTTRVVTGAGMPRSPPSRRSLTWRASTTCRSSPTVASATPGTPSRPSPRVRTR